MHIINYNDQTILNDKLVVTIGQFDGLHLGHMELINTVLKEKKDTFKTCLITFNPHIDSILFNESPNNYLISLDDKTKMLDQLGFDYLLIIDFNQDVAKITHQEFYKKYLQSLNIQKLIVGFDFSYGYKGLGNTNTLKEIYQDKLIVIPKKEINNQKVGSFQIKQDIKNCDLKSASSLLGYEFYLNGSIKDNKFTCSNIELLPINKYIVSINGNDFILDTKNQTINYPNQDNIKLIVKSKA